MSDPPIPPPIPPPGESTPAPYTPAPPPYGAGPPPGYGAGPPPGYGAGPPPGYGAPGPAAYQPMPPATRGSNGLAVAALVLGILTFVCLGPIGAILAIVFGALGLKRAKEIGDGQGMSIAGIVLGSVGMVGSIIAIILLVTLGATATHNLNNFGGEADPSTFTIATGACGVDLLGTATFSGTIKNTTSSSKNFSIKAEFRNQQTGAVIDTSSDLVSDIAPGDTAQWRVTSLGNQAGSAVRCQVLEVDNFFN